MDKELSSDAFGGRAPGTSGEEQTVAWLIEQAYEGALRAVETSAFPLAAVLRAKMGAAEHQVAVELEAGWLTKIADTPEGLTRTIGVTTRAGWRPTAMQAAFVGALNEAASYI